MGREDTLVLKRRAMDEGTPEKPISWDKERRVVAVFTDIAGSTQMINRLAEADKVDVAQQFKKRISTIFDEVADKYGAVFPLPEGDAYALFWGLQPDENDPVRASEAILELRDRFRHDDELNGIRNQNQEVGELILHMGVDFEENALLFQTKPELGRYGYEYYGQGIHRAARLMKGPEDHDEDWTIYTSGDFAQKVGHLINVSFAGVGVKDFPKQDVWKLVDRKPDVRQIGRRLSRTKLIGRERELNQLRRAAESLEDGMPVSLLLREDLGSGKSRLLSELKKSTGLLYLETGCDSVDRGDLASFKDLVRSKKPEEKQLRRLKKDLPFLSDFLDESPDSDYVVTKERKFESLYNLLETYFMDRPGFVVVEDLHWADEETVEFVRYTDNRIRQAQRGYKRTGEKASFGLIVTTRPEVEEKIGRRVKLKPLSRNNARTLLKERIGSLFEQIPKKEVDKVVANSEGNPYFLESAAQSYLTDRTWDVSTTDLGQAQKSRKDRIRRRDVRIALEYIVAQGSYSREFDVDVLSAASPVRIDQDVLKELEASQWIQHIADGRYQIYHHSIQESIYSELGRRSSEIHRKIAEAIERSTDDKERGLDELEKLAHHWERSDKPRRAVKYLEKARDASVNQPSRAVSFSGRALRIIDDEITRLEKSDEDDKEERRRSYKQKKVGLMSTMATVIGSRLGNYPGAQEIFEQTREMIDELEAPIDDAGFVTDMWLGVIARNTGNYDRARRTFEEAQQRLDPSRKSFNHRVISCAINLAQTYYRMGERETEEQRRKRQKERKSAEMKGEEPLKEYDRTNPDPFHVAIQHYELAETLARKTEGNKGLGHALTGRASALKKLKRHEDALELYKLYLKSVNGNQEAMAMGLCDIGDCYLDMGRPQDALGYNQRALDTARQSGSRLAEIYALRNLGIAHSELNDKKQARRHFRDAYRLADECNNPNKQKEEILDHVKKYGLRIRSN